MKKYLILVLLILAPLNSFAQEKITFTKNQIELLNNAQDYLARVRTVRANFIQVNPGSDIISSGEVLISKPGRLKMSYSAPYQIDYYINDDNLLQYDRELDEVSRGDAPENPLKILLYDDLSLAHNDIMDVTNVADQGSTFSVYLLNKAQKIRDISGMVLKFRKTPIELAGVERVDYEGNKTETNFTAVKINEKIDDSEFIFKKAKAAYPNSSKKR